LTRQSSNEIGAKSGFPNEARSRQTLLTQGLRIGFFGSGLYFAVDRYEPDRTVAFMLKFLVVLWAAAAVLHCTGLFGYGFF
jgi:hypothetical protein